MIIPPLLTAMRWNARPLTWSDFERAAEECGVTVQRAPVKTPGMYFECRGRAIITLSNRLCGVRLWLVAWHELSHHLLHAPGLRCYSPASVSKAEAEAEMIALCAVLDERTLTRILHHGELHDYPRDLLKRRLQIVDRYGL
jgi:Zn-dependent peptidase ImmA (M78 family)